MRYERGGPPGARARRGARRDLAGRRARRRSRQYALAADGRPLGAAGDRAAHRGALRARTSSTRSTRRAGAGRSDRALPAALEGRPLRVLRVRRRDDADGARHSGAARDGLVRRRGGPVLAHDRRARRRTSTPGSRRTSDGTGFQVFDPTPPARRARPPSQSFSVLSRPGGRRPGDRVLLRPAHARLRRGRPGRRLRVGARVAGRRRGQPRRAAPVGPGRRRRRRWRRVLVAGLLAWLLWRGVFAAPDAAGPGDAGVPRAARAARAAGRSRAAVDAARGGGPALRRGGPRVARGRARRRGDLLRQRLRRRRARARGRAAASPSASAACASSRKRRARYRIRAATTVMSSTCAVPDWNASTAARTAPQRASAGSFALSRRIRSRRASPNSSSAASGASVMPSE